MFQRGMQYLEITFNVFKQNYPSFKLSTVYLFFKKESYPYRTICGGANRAKNKLRYHIHSNRIMGSKQDSLNSIKEGQALCPVSILSITNCQSVMR